jgi:hypothetical protein
MHSQDSHLKDIQVNLAIEYCITCFPLKGIPLYYKSPDDTMTSNDSGARKDGSLPPSLLTSGPRLTPLDTYPLDK